MTDAKEGKETVYMIYSFLILQENGCLRNIMLHFMVERKGIVVDNIISECFMSFCLNRTRPLSFS